MKTIRASIGLIILSCALSCSSTKDFSTKEIEEELNKINENEAEVLEEIKLEILLRNSDTLKQSEVMYVTDSTLVQSDSGFFWKLNHQSIKRNSELSEYPTDSLIKILSQKIIYGLNGEDNRNDLCDLDKDSPFRKTTQQVACLVKKNNLLRREDGNYMLQGKPFSEAKYLCGAERFYNQIVPGFCSGFAVSKDQIATAGHCASTETLSEFLIVFGFAMTSKDSIKTIFSPSDIYKPLSIVRKGPDDQGNDYAIITVDHSIPETRIATVRTIPANLREPVFVIGHPCGLPLKIADGAKVISNNNLKYFNANLDTYGGNSGSPVYDSLHHVIGILVRGERDFNYNFQNGCYSSNICPVVGVSGCEGESVSRNIQFAHHINK